MSVSPTAFFDIAETVLGCVCGAMDQLAIDEEGYPGCPCHAYTSPGTPALDVCCDDCNGSASHGQLTVHTEDIYISESFPTKSVVIFPQCKTASYVAAVVVTVARCAPSMNEQGDAPSAAAMTSAARLQYLDHYAVLNALTCCLTQIAPAGRRKRRVVLSGFRANNPEGGCATIEIRAQVEVGQVCSCPEEGS